MARCGFRTDNEPATRNDGILTNVLTGMGDPNRDQSMATVVSPAAPLLSEGQLEALYTTSWLMRKIVNIFPGQGTRSGWDISMGESTRKKEKDSKLLVAAGEKLRARAMFGKAATLARLHGGGALIMLLDDRTPLDQPVNLKRLQKVRGLYPIDRWRLWPSPGWSGVGEPESYYFHTLLDKDLEKAGADPSVVQRSQVTLHASRVLRFEGLQSTWRQQQRTQWWGLSALQPIWDVFKRYETGQSSAAAILHDFDLYIHQLDGLERIIDSGNQKQLMDRLQANALARSVYGALVIGKGETISNITRSAAGISDILDSLKGEITGAAEIPHTKLWGESPSGLGADGRSEEASFANDVALWQHDNLSENLKTFYRMLMAASEGPFGGREEPEDWDIEFRPTYTPTEEEQAELRSKVAQADSQWIQAQVLKPNEVALGRFGQPKFSQNTTLIDREEDGSIPQEEQGPVEFSGFGEDPNADPNAEPGAEQGGGPGAPPQEQAGQPPGGDLAGGEPQPKPPRKDSVVDPSLALARSLSNKLRGAQAARGDSRAGASHGIALRFDGRGLAFLQGPYGAELPHPVVVGNQGAGLFEVFEPNTGAYALVLGAGDRAAIRTAAPAARVRALDSIDLVAMGVRCDAYETE